MREKEKIKNYHEKLLTGGFNKLKPLRFTSAGIPVSVRWNAVK